MLVLVLLGYYWVICLALGFYRLRKVLRRYEDERWAEKPRK